MRVLEEGLGLASGRTGLRVVDSAMTLNTHPVEVGNKLLDLVCGDLPEERKRVLVRFVICRPEPSGEHQRPRTPKDSVASD